MANEEQLAILKQGVDVWNQWREDKRITFPQLDGADFSGMNLSCAKFERANLTQSLFVETNLTQANLRSANLNSANLIGADLSQADIRGYRATRTFVDIPKRITSMISANLTRTKLSGAKFNGTLLGQTILGATDLSEIIDIEKVFHYGASTIGMDTIYNSKGKIPEIFLRGCGLSDLQIEFAKLAAPGLDSEQVTDITYKIHQLYLGTGIQYYSCFISYNSKDEAFARQLHDDLQNNGVRCWFAPEDLKIGDQIRPRIDQEIRMRDKLLVILSENSIKSEWVGDEVEGAIEEESKSNRLVLFPIRLDDTVMSTRDDWAAKIKRRRHIGDFSNWKDKASYQKAFEHLLRDLKAAGGDVHGE